MGRYIRIGFVVVALLATAVLLPDIVSTREGATKSPPRQVRNLTLVVRGMTYYVEGSEAPNPELRFAAGEQVRLTLRNADPGMTHDFNIKAWRVATKLLAGTGEDVVLFRVPARTTTPVIYTCTPHSEMMTGTIIVE